MWASWVEKSLLRVVVIARARQYNLGNPTGVKYGDDGVDGWKLVLTEAVQRRLWKVLNVRRPRARRYMLYICSYEVYVKRHSRDRPKVS